MPLCVRKNRKQQHNAKNSYSFEFFRAFKNGMAAEHAHPHSTLRLVHSGQGETVELQVRQRDEVERTISPRYEPDVRITQAAMHLPCSSPASVRPTTGPPKTTRSVHNNLVDSPTIHRLSLLCVVVHPSPRSRCAGYIIPLPYAHILHLA